MAQHQRTMEAPTPRALALRRASRQPSRLTGQHFEEALSLARAAKDELIGAYQLGCLGAVARTENELDRAEALWRECLTIAVHAQIGGSSATNCSHSRRWRSSAGDCRARPDCSARARRTRTPSWRAWRPRLNPRVVARDGAVWAVVRPAGALVRIDPDTDSIAQTIMLDVSPTGLTLSDDAMWVTAMDNDLVLDASIRG